MSFFEAAVDGSAITRARSTKILQHPITEGMSEAVAKCAVGLNVPGNAALIDADDKTVLAAMPYRLGRVVISAFGQWYLPDPSTIGLRGPPPRWVNHWTRSLNPDELPIEFGAGGHVELLRSTLAWLTEERERDATFFEQRKRLEEACHAALLVYSRAESWDTMKPFMQSLVVESPSGVWREEMLWAAGECYQQLLYYASPSYKDHGWYGLRRNDVFDSNPEYYRELVAHFPNSPLRSFALWRLGECERRRQINIYRSQQQGRNFTDSEADPQSAIDVFQQVDAASGSYSWAWTPLRIGMLMVKSGRIQEAVEVFGEVADTMPAGPEKAIALLSQIECLKSLNRQEDVNRCRDAALAIPNIYWWSDNAFTCWSALKISGSFQRGTTKKLATR